MTENQLKEIEKRVTELERLVMRISIALLVYFIADVTLLILKLMRWLIEK